MQVKHLKRGTIYNVLGTATVRGGMHIYDDAPIIIFKNEKGIFVTDFSCQAPSFDCEFVYFGRAQTEVTQVYGDQMVVYQDIQDLKVYARAEAEFWDGRFIETNFMQENLEFESGQLVKYNGRRIEYMDGYELIRMCKEMGKLLAQDKSPAAPVEGLETIGYHIAGSATAITKDKDVTARWTLGNPNSIIEEVITRSQSEAIIAAKDAEIKQLKTDLQSHIDGTTALVDEKIDAEFKAVDLEKDNAALTARVKELEKHLDTSTGCIVQLEALLPFPAESDPGEHPEVLDAIDACNSGEEQ